MECLRNKTRVLAETVIFFVFGRYILWLWVSNIRQFLYWLLFPSFSWAGLQLNRRCVFFQWTFNNDIHRALWKYCWSSSANLCGLLIWIFLPRQKNINFINWRFWKDGFQNCYFREPIVVSNKFFKRTIWWKLVIVSVYERGSVYLDQKKFYYKGVSEMKTISSKVILIKGNHVQTSCIWNLRNF